MLSRRSLFSLFVGAGAVAAGAKVVEASPAAMSLGQIEALRWEIADAIGLPYVMVWGQPDPKSFDEYLKMGMPTFENVQVPARERFEIMEYEPVNVRSDGSIRHRQHHPVDFPPRGVR